MKILQLIARLLGAIALVTGMSACNKDDDKGGNECCSYSYTDNGITYTFKACESGTLTYTTSEGVRETYNWEDYYDSWSEVKQSFLDEGGSCD
jgi:hypothetical protein